MSERANAIYKCYTNLEYDKKWNNDVSTLSRQMTFNDVYNFSERCLKIVSVIKKNLSHFQSQSRHVDEVTAIIDYLTHFGNFYGVKYDEIILCIMSTFYCCVYVDLDVLAFLEKAILKGAVLNEVFANKKEFFSKGAALDEVFASIKKFFSANIEMIILEDSDLYAVISYLKMKRDHGDSHKKTKIWVQGSIKEKFLWLVEEYFKDETIPTTVFQSKKDLRITNTFNEIDIISIWSEDIIGAKNLAASLNADVVFINTHMDFSGGVILFPYVKIIGKPLHEDLKCNIDICPLKSDAHLTCKSVNKKDASNHDTFKNLFYNGIWQAPVKGTFWVYCKHDTCNELWANATCDDVDRCVESAQKGFKVWSNTSTEKRLTILKKFISLLECNCKFELATTLSELINFLYIHGKQLLCTQNEGLEVIRVRKPRGVIVIKEKEESLLLHRVMESLFAGNSVIVICDLSSCSLASERGLSYCDLFSMSNLPPGVVNLLSIENAKDLEVILCDTDYDSYSKRIFTEDKLSTYMNLTLSKHIALSLK